MFEASVAFNLLEHVCGYVFDPPLGEFGWSRMLSSVAPPLPHQGRLCLHHALYGPQLVRLLRRDRQAGALRRPPIHAACAAHPEIDRSTGSSRRMRPGAPTAEWIELCDRAEHPRHAGDPADGALGRPAHPRDRPARHRRASDGGPLPHHRLAGEIHRDADEHPQARAQSRRGHGRASCAQRGLPQDEIELLLARGVLRQARRSPQRRRDTAEPVTRASRVMTGAVRLTVDGAVATIDCRDPPTRNSLSFPMIAELTGSPRAERRHRREMPDSHGGGRRLLLRRQRQGDARPRRFLRRQPARDQAAPGRFRAGHGARPPRARNPDDRGSRRPGLRRRLRPGAALRHAHRRHECRLRGDVPEARRRLRRRRRVAPAAHPRAAARRLSHLHGRADLRRGGGAHRPRAEGGRARGARRRGGALADRIANKPAHSLRAAKRLLRQSLEGGTLATHLELAANMHGVLQHTEDQKEAVAAFFEKRPPNFVNR